jgi:hypothetical protein
VIAHESGETHRARKRGSPRSFGLAFAAVFALVGLFPVLRHREPRIWFLGASLALVLIAFAYPRMLEAPNRLWQAIGEKLSLVTSTILVAVIYFVVVTPMGILARMRGKDALKLKVAPESSTYWIVRDRADLTAESLTRQF